MISTPHKNRMMHTYKTKTANLKSALLSLLIVFSINMSKASTPGETWTARTAAETNEWASVTYGDGLFVAVSTNGTNRVMTSVDGINWTARAAAEDNNWQSVTYGDGLFVAVAVSGTNRVMTSPDGMNWTARSAPGNNGWLSVTYGDGVFVAVAGSGTNRVMTSPDGMNWTARAAAENNFWQSVTYGDGLFVAVAGDGTNRVMTSTDGINWTARSAAEDNLWQSVTYGNGLFVAVAQIGTNQIMTSPDGINWTVRAAAENNSWYSITYGDGLFVAVAYTGTNRVMTSPDGMNWTARAAAENNFWISVTYGDGLFVAVAIEGTNRVMTSGELAPAGAQRNICYNTTPDTIQSEAMPTGGSESYAYLWQQSIDTVTWSAAPGVNDTSFYVPTVALTDTTYFRRLVVDESCGDSAYSNTMTINVFDSIGIDFTATQLPCFNSNDGTIKATVSGGNAPYSYSWNTTESTDSIGGLSAGVYTLTITDNEGCTKVKSIEITQPDTLILTSTTLQNVSCNGGNDGELQLVATGGTQPYQLLSGETFAFDGDSVFSGVPAVNNSPVQVIDANGCTGGAVVNITEPATLVTTAVVDSNITCNGLSNGGKTASATGGTTPYTYAWSNGATTASITGVSAGTYSVTITDANGCTDSASGTVTEPAALVASSVVDSNVTCFGLTNGGASSSATGGTTPYAYLWSNSATTASITGVAAGTYSVTITDHNGCTSTSSEVITEPDTLILTSTTLQNVSCNGGSDGEIQLVATGGTQPYQLLSGETFAFDGDSVFLGAPAVNNSPVQVIDANGCTGGAIINVTEPAVLFTQTNVTSTVSCYGGSDAEVTTTTTGGTMPYNYVWSTGATTSGVTGLSSGAYTVTVTDNNGCSLVRTQTIGQPDSISAAITVDASVDCFGGNQGALSVNVSGGTAPYNYNWNNGGATNNIINLTAGTYTVTITDDNGCTKVLTDSIVEPDVLASSITVDANVSCNAGTNGSLTVSATGGTSPSTYLWSNGITSATASGLTAGTYTVTVTDNNGCTTTSSSVVTEPTQLMAATTVDSNVTCFDGTNGGTTLTASGGTAPYNYQWSNAETTASITGVAAGTYTVTVTDNNGCSTTSSAVITEPTQIIASINVDSNVTCNGLADGGLTLTASGGTGALSYAWNTTESSTSITSLVAGTYTVTITDQNGCTTSLSEVITEPASLTANAAVDSTVSCATFADGGATVTANGGTTPYSYQWTNSATTASITGVTAGTYTVTITDNNGCSTTTNVTVGEPNPLAVNLAADSTVTCNGLANGGVTATASAGTAPYTYLWSTGATSASITQLSAATYSVTVTDINGCDISDAIIMTEPTVISATAAVDSNVTCNGLADGGATVSVNGGTAPYSYDWSNTDNTASIDGLAAGVYTVEVTDANGCTDQASISISEPTVLDMTTNIEDAIDCYGFTGEISASADGGTRPYAYSWSNGSRSIINSNVEAGTYTVTVTDANGCTLVENQTITQPDSLTLTAVVEPEQFQGDGRIDLTVTGGTGTYIYDWDNDQSGDFDDNQDQNTLPTGEYQVIVEDVNGCRDTASYFVGSNVSTFPILESAAVNVYPTPTTGLLNIEHEGLLINQIFIFSIEGKVVYQSNTGINQIDISNLERATYFMEIHTDRGIIQKRIIRR